MALTDIVFTQPGCSVASRGNGGTLQDTLFVSRDCSSVSRGNIGVLQDILDIKMVSNLFLTIPTPNQVLAGIVFNAQGSQTGTAISGGLGPRIGCSQICGVEF